MKLVKMAEEMDKYLRHLRTRDILGAAEKAKHKSMELLEEQGIAAIAPYMSNLLAKSVKEMEKIHEI